MLAIGIILRRNFKLCLNTCVLSSASQVEEIGKGTDMKTLFSSNEKQRAVGEETLIRLARNGLLVAGHEMGPGGDHEPLIKATIHSLMAAWEQRKLNEAVQAEMKQHLYVHLAAMERRAAKVSPQEQAQALPLLRELRAIYDAHFAPVDPAHLEVPDLDSLPPWVRRAEHILETLENGHEA